MAQRPGQFRLDVVRVLGLPSGATDAEIMAAVDARAQAVKANRDFRQKAAKSLGLPADSSEAAILAEVDKRKAARDAEAAERAEDARLVEAAAASGRLPSDRKHFWINAMRTDRPRSRQLLASLPVTVAPAAAAPARVVTDDLGLPIPQIPDRVLTQKGKPASEYTHDDHYALFARALGPAFRRDAPPVPKQDAYYQPGVNDYSRPVVGRDGVVTHFEDNPHYQPNGN